MADNTQVPGGTGDTVRDKDRAGVKTQIVGLDLGIGTGTENLMAGTMPVSLASVPTVTEKQDQPTATAVTWTSATALNTASAVTTTGYGTANVFIVVPTTVTAGVISIEVSNDGGTTYVPGGAVRVDNGYQENVVALAFAPGINGNRMYSVSVDAMTHIRARLSTVIAGTGNVVVTISTVAGGIEPFVAQRARTVPTYTAGYRLATVSAESSLTFTHVANTDKQYATIYHPASATKTVRLQYVGLQFVAISSVAANFWVELRALSATTAPATGNPAITPRAHDTSDPAAEATCLALPTTAGSEAAANSPLFMNRWDIGLTAGGGTGNPIPIPGYLTLYDRSNSQEERPLAIRAGVAEGFAVIVRASAAAVTRFFVLMRFTEEAP